MSATLLHVILPAGIRRSHVERSLCIFRIPAITSSSGITMRGSRESSRKAARRPTEGSKKALREPEDSPLSQSKLADRFTLHSA